MQTEVQKLNSIVAVLAAFVAAANSRPVKKQALTNMAVAFEQWRRNAVARPDYVGKILEMQTHFQNNQG